MSALQLKNKDTGSKKKKKKKKWNLLFNFKLAQLGSILLDTELKRTRVHTSKTMCQSLFNLALLLKGLKPGLALLAFWWTPPLIVLLYFVIDLYLPVYMLFMEIKSHTRDTSLMLFSKTMCRALSVYRVILFKIPFNINLPQLIKTSSPVLWSLLKTVEAHKAKIRGS